MSQPGSSRFCSQNNSTQEGRRRRGEIYCREREATAALLVGAEPVNHSVLTQPAEIRYQPFRYFHQLFLSVKLHPYVDDFLVAVHSNTHQVFLPLWPKEHITSKVNRNRSRAVTHSSSKRWIPWRVRWRASKPCPLQIESHSRAPSSLRWASSWVWELVPSQQWRRSSRGDLTSYRAGLVL
jgi:hypothetical protein